MSAQPRKYRPVRRGHRAHISTNQGATSKSAIGKWTTSGCSSFQADIASDRVIARPFPSQFDTYDLSLGTLVTNHTKLVKALSFSQRRSKSLRMAPRTVKMLLPAEALCPKDSRLRTKKAGRNSGRPPGEGMIEPKVVSPRDVLFCCNSFSNAQLFILRDLFAGVRAERLRS